MKTTEKVAALYAARRKPSPVTPVVLARRGDVAEVQIYGEIGSDVTPDTFAAALADAQGAKELRLLVHSPGGSVFDAKAMMAQIERFDGRVTAVVDGIAASAASFLILAADVIEMAPESVLMVHLPVASSAGNAADLRAMADLLDKETESLVRMYVARCGAKSSPEAIRDMLAAETFLNASEALALGLCDRIAGRPARRSIAATVEETRRLIGIAERNALLRRATGGTR